MNTFNPYAPMEHSTGTQSLKAWWNGLDEAERTTLSKQAEDDARFIVSQEPVALKFLFPLTLALCASPIMVVAYYGTFGVPYSGVTRMVIAALVLLAAPLGVVGLFLTVFWARRSRARIFEQWRQMGMGLERVYALTQTSSALGGAKVARHYLKKMGAC